MTEAGPLAKALMQQFPDMPAQLQVAARFVLDHPKDVALLSMREQAKRAGVPPATMTRLAQRMGFPGYDNVRAAYADSVRRGLDGFSNRVEDLADRHRVKGRNAVAVDLVETLAEQVGALRAQGAREGISRAAERIAGARRVFLAGQRSSYPIAYHLGYVGGLVGCDTRLLDGPGGTGPDALHDAGPDDVVVVVSIRPYAAASLHLAKYVARRGIPIVAVTDSRMSPFARLANEAVVVGVESPSFFHTMVPALTAVEAIVALVAVARGERARAALAARESFFEATDALLMLPPSKAEKL